MISTKFENPLFYTACATHDTCMVLSSSATTSIEHVAQNSRGGLHWFQLYVSRDRSLAAGLVRRAEQAGYKALVVTVDAPAVGRRLNDLRYGFSLPSHLALVNLKGSSTKYQLKKDSTESERKSVLVRLSNNLLDSSLTWKDITWLMSITSMPVVVKGVLTAEDARIAVKLGVKGILVSNHGARQLDGVPATVSLTNAVNIFL